MMKNLKIGICESNNVIREQLRIYCQKLGFNNIITYHSGKELLKSKELLSINLLFLDYETNYLNGIDMKRAIERISPSTLIVCLITHSVFMSDTFGKNVICCLQKPVSEYDVAYCLDKVTDLEKEIYTISLDRKTSVCCKDILYLHSEQKYTVFYTPEGKTFSSHKSLNAWEDVLLDLGFCRIHRSYLMNLKYITFINQKGITLSTGEVLPVSRRYFHQAITSYKNYHSGN